MPFYIITVKAKKEISQAVFQLICHYFKAHVRAEAFTNKPYEHLHAVISVKAEISYKKAHKLVEELKAELGNFWLGFRRIWDRRDLRKAEDYVKAHERGDGMESLEERVKKLEAVVDKLAGIVADMSEKLDSLIPNKAKNTKPKVKEAENRAEIYINNTKISLIESRKDGYKLLILERRKESFKLWLSVEDWEALKQFLDSYVADKPIAKNKKVKVIKGYKKAIER